MSNNTLISDKGGALIDINAGQTARNGLIPSGVVARRILNGLAYLLQRQQRMVWWAGQGLDTGVGIYSTTASHDYSWAHAFHTGYGCTKLIYYVVTFTNAATPGGTPQFQIREAGGSINSDIVYQIDTTPVHTIGLGLILSHRVELGGLSENTDYQCHIRTDNNMRICGACAFEEKRYDSITTSSLTTGYTQARFSNGGPVLGDDWALMANMAEGLWTANAACVFSYCRVGDNASYDVLKTANSSYENLFDSSKTTFGATDIGITVNTEYTGLSEGGKNAVTTHPKLQCYFYAKVDSGAGTIQVKDTSGAICTTATFNNTSYEWKAAAGDLIDQSGGHHIGFFAKNNAAGDTKIAAISCWLEN